MTLPVFVTGNKGKLREVNHILKDNPITNQDVDLEEIQGSIEEIAEHKARTAANFVKGPVLVEDTALEFNAMKGLPGPYIKWFLKKLDNDGLVKMLEGFEDKGARAICTFAYCAGPGEEVKLFQGINEGSIVPPTGPPDFGWNPIFKPNGYDQTYAEMTADLKNSVSHRKLAMDKLVPFLKTLA